MPAGLVAILLFLFLSCLASAYLASSSSQYVLFYWGYSIACGLSFAGILLRFKPAWFLLIAVFGLLIAMYTNTLIFALSYDYIESRQGLIIKKVAQLFFLTVGLIYLFTARARAFFGVRGQAASDALSGDDSEVFVERNMAVRVLASIGWLLLIIVVVELIIAVIVGVVVTNPTMTVDEAMQAGASAEGVVTMNFGWAIFVGQVLIWLVLSVLGVLPGTTKFKKARHTDERNR